VGRRCWGVVDFGSQIGEFWFGAIWVLFVQFTYKAGLNAVPDVKITLGTPFPGVPAGNDPCLRLLS